MTNMLQEEVWIILLDHTLSQFLDVKLNMACQVTGSAMAYSQSITLNCLNSSTTYNYCVVATNATDMERVGEPVCGSFTTRTIASDDSDDTDGMSI